MRRHGHDRAGAVVGQHIVGGPDTDALSVHRVDRVPAQEDPGLRPIGRLTLDIGQLAYLSLVCVQFFPPLGNNQLSGQRRVGGNHEEGGTVQRVGPRREYGDRLIPAFDDELDLGTFAAADPVALHQQHPVGPAARQRLHVCQQPVGVLRDPEVPLR